MVRSLVIILLLSVLSLNSARAAGPDVNDPRWGCYDPLPGHTTDKEKTAFITAMGPAALAAEQHGGPPAAGLLAMSSLESGFGWTRTAIFGNNLFGWKFTGTAAAEGRSDWILACQAASDPNKHYIVFRYGADSITFVAGRLASIERYAAVTPAAATGPASPAPVPSPGSVASRSASAQAAAVALAGVLERSRYMSQRCDPAAITDWPNYEGRNVRRCQYSVTSAGKTLSALVYLLNPADENIVARIEDACLAIGWVTVPAAAGG